VATDSMEKWKQRIENIPYWAINGLSIISGVITIVTAGIGTWAFFSSKRNSGQLDINLLLLLIIALLVLVAISLLIKLWKYRKLSKARLRNGSEVLHKLTHEFRDVLFDVLHYYKSGQLNQALLSTCIENFLKRSLDLLCKIMGDYTGCEVCSCIKLIEYDNEIKIETAKVTVFCRSSNTNNERINYDRQPQEVYVKEDTALMQVVGDNAKDHFSCADLKKYREQHSKEKEFYKNPNQNWEKYYIGTFIVPIRIEYKRLFFMKNKESYHVIGFLCLDSLSKNAFLANQERYNADMIKAFADLFYVVLNKYSYYLRKMSQPKQNTVRVISGSGTIFQISSNIPQDADNPRKAEEANKDTKVQ